jgi:hypothetical protein
METAPREVWQYWAALQLVDSPAELGDTELSAARIIFDNRDFFVGLNPWDIPTFGMELKEALSKNPKETEAVPIWRFIAGDFVKKNKFIKNFYPKDKLVDAVINLALKVFADQPDKRVLVEVLSTHVKILQAFNESTIQGLIDYLESHFLEKEGKVTHFSPSYSDIADTMAPWFQIMDKDEINGTLNNLRDVLLRSLDELE